MSNLIIKPEHQSAPKIKPKRQKWNHTDPKTNPLKKQEEAFSKKWMRDNESKLTDDQKKQILDNYKKNPNNLPGLVPLPGKSIRSTFSHVPEEKWNKIFKKEPQVQGE
jgi:hypothetical protein